MLNERLTEYIVREQLRSLNYCNPDNDDIIVEEQKSQIDEVQRLLKGASKTGKGGIGAPEFIISSTEHPDFLIVFECKASINDHESSKLDNPVKYAVDGVLHYAKALAKSYNVVAIAVSGSKKTNLKISSYVVAKNTTEQKVLTNKNQMPIEEILSFEDFLELSSYNPEVEKARYNDLMAFSRELHEFMRDHAKLTESEKPLLVSGTLIALRNKGFSKAYSEYSASELQKEWMETIKKEIEKAEIPNSKKYNMTQPYSSIAVHPELGKSSKQFPKGPLYKLIHDLNQKVWPFISVYHDFDVVGQFYGEFLKYTGGDKKALGIVLTPKHITELFSSIANLQKNSIVLDICTGTGAFLISAMNYMFKLANTDDEKKYIKQNCLIGVEQQPNMYALAASNMILRGDGKANLYQGSCFDTPTVEAIKELKCDVGMINPPYSQSDSSLHELSFVNHMLNCLKIGGKGIAIIPINCVLSPSDWKEELLKNHTLDAVMSMPNELFYPVGVVTCIVVFTAHVPHNSNPYHKTWFGYWKDDGYYKTKHLGRISDGEWDDIKEEWLDMFHNRIEKPGVSVMQKVSANDEWCAEAYMETDYSELTQEDFEKTVKDFLMFKIANDL